MLVNKEQAGHIIPVLAVRVSSSGLLATQNGEQFVFRVKFPVAWEETQLYKLPESFL